VNIILTIFKTENKENSRVVEAHENSTIKSNKITKPAVAKKTAFGIKNN